MAYGAYAKLGADKTGDRQSIIQAFRRIFRSDVLITIPSLLVITLLNFIVNNNYSIFSIEIKWLVLLFTIHSLIIFITVIHPLRAAMYKMVLDSIDYDTIVYKTFSKTWFIWGTVELAPLIAVLAASTINLF